MLRMDLHLECCVLGCHTRPNQGLRFYRFPCHNPQISSIWEQRICQPANIDIDIANDSVCELHFDYRCKTGNECALEDGSLPTLHLPSFGTVFSTGNAHFHMSADRIEEPSYTISVDTLTHHCRFCLRRGLLYEVETSTYRSKSFSSLIDLTPNVLPDNTQPNACLSCLKSIVIAHRLSVAVEHSNTILQQLLQNPKRSTVVSNTNFFDIKSELAFCNLIAVNSLFIKLEIEIEDSMVWTNEDYEQKPTPPAFYVNTTSMVDNSICVAKNQDNVSKKYDSVTSDKQCPKEIYKSFAIGAEYRTDLAAEGILDASENSDFCVPVENTNDNAEVMVSNNSNDSCAEDRQIDNEQAQESTSKAVNEPNWQTTFTTIDQVTHWKQTDGKTLSSYSFNALMAKHVQIDKKASIETQELEILETDPARNEDGRYQCTECPITLKNKNQFGRHKLIHTNERPYKCTECSKTFRRKFDVDTHKRIHTNERPYKCAECPKTFSQSGHLSVHMRLHTNEKPYKCTKCPKTFSYKSTLETHKRRHTSERMYPMPENFQ